MDVGRRRLVRCIVVEVYWCGLKLNKVELTGVDLLGFDLNGGCDA